MMNFTGEQKLQVGEIEILNYLPKRGIDAVRNEILTGLKSEQKYISPKYFYDESGSVLFENITQLDEYYPTRCEKEILSTLIGKLDIDWNELDIIELGSGDPSKIKSLFSQIPPEFLATINYYPVDISPSAIENSVQDIIREFDLNNITGIVADFFHHHDYLPGRNKRLFCFLGSTIGNFTREEAENFMRELGRAMDAGDGLLLGLDMVKDISVIESAYNDKEGVTAAFNKNILHVVNSHIQSDFDTSDFEHLAFFNPEARRIEMHLRAKRNVKVVVGYTNESLQIKKGETIHTENSHKFTVDQLEKIGRLGRMKINTVFPDSKGWFNLVHYVKTQ